MHAQDNPVSALDCSTGRSILRRVCPKRRTETHKGHYGTVLLFCGSVGLAGAAFFASRAAAVSGAGLIHLVVPDSIYLPLALSTPEVMVHPCTASPEGRLTEDAVNQQMNLIQKADAILIGCGLGCDNGIKKFVRQLFTVYSGYIVLDADGINALQETPELLSRKKLVITPHEGELARIGYSRKPEESRLLAAKRIVPSLGCTLVLKGPQTAVVAPDGRYCENTTGNPGMSKGGSGDILAGLLAGFLAHHPDDFESSAAAVYIHGAAGDLAAKELGETGMRPLDILKRIPAVLHNELHY